MNENTDPVITPGLFAKTFYSLLRYQRPPPEVIPILLWEARKDNFEALYCLTLDEVAMQLAFTDRIFVWTSILDAAKEGNPCALYVKGCSAVLGGTRHEVALGIQMLEDAGENGAPDAYWRIAKLRLNDRPKAAVEYAKQAANGGWPPAIEGLDLGTAMSSWMEQSVRASCHHDLSLEREGRKASELKIKQLSDDLQALRLSSGQLIQQLQQRCEEAEARLASWAAEALKDERIQLLQCEKAKAEEDWLQTKCDLESAEASKAMAERIANKLTGRNKYLACLLRKNGIPFNDCESSSSSENGESHLGLAS